MKFQEVVPKDPVKGSWPYPEDLQLLSLRQVSILTGLGLTKINEELSSKRLRSLKVGKRRLVTIGYLRLWVSANAEGLDTSTESEKVADACARGDK